MHVHISTLTPTYRSLQIQYGKINRGNLLWFYHFLFIMMITMKVFISLKYMLLSSSGHKETDNRHKGLGSFFS